MCVCGGVRGGEVLSEKLRRRLHLDDLNWEGGKEELRRKSTSCLPGENSVPAALHPLPCQERREWGQLQTQWVEGQYQSVPIGLSRRGDLLK